MWGPRNWRAREPVPENLSVQGWRSDNSLRKKLYAQTHFSHDNQHVLASPEPGLLQLLHDGLYRGHSPQRCPPHPARQGAQDQRRLPPGGLRGRRGVITPDTGTVPRPGTNPSGLS
jgi:hypothetical protein